VTELVVVFYVQPIRWFTVVESQKDKATISQHHPFAGAVLPSPDFAWMANVMFLIFTAVAIEARYMAMFEGSIGTKLEMSFIVTAANI
jgi:hypothetical protein